MAEVIIDKLPPSKMIRNIEIAGPGFINLYLAQEIAFEPVINCLEHNEQFGHHSYTNERIQVEYVSANQRDPHVGHGRGAAYGATLVNLLRLVDMTWKQNIMSMTQVDRWTFWRSVFFYDT